MDDASLDKALAAVQERASGLEAFGSTIRFDFNDGAAITIDGNQTPPSVSKDSDSEVDCTITASAEVFEQLLDGDLDPTMAFMSGKVSVDGSMGAAMQMTKLLG